MILLFDTTLSRSMGGQFRNIQVLADWVDSHPHQSAAVAVSLAAAVAIADWTIGANVSLGVLYIFAMILAGFAIPRSWIMLFALICAILREALGPYQWQPAYELRVALVSGAFGGVGILVSELNRNRRLEIENFRQREQFLLARQESERQLSTLLETSPLPILIADASGSVLVANEASRGLLELSSDDVSTSLFDYLPELRTVVHGMLPRHDGVRREIECAGRRRSGEPFFAHVWMAGYPSNTGMRMAVVLWDASEDLQGREMATVASVMATSRVLLAGFAHEVRNLSAAASALWSRLAARRHLKNDEEYQAVERTLESLAHLAASGLRLGATRPESFVDLSSTMEQIRIVLQPMLDAAGVEVVWNVPERLPRVHGDHSALMQVFLNLASNSERATRDLADRQFGVEALMDLDAAMLQVWDNGPGVASPERLFEPFRSEAGGTGVGLYVSRAMLRSCGGDLWYEPSRGGARFCIRLLPVDAE
jgi:signal transduction histidine kinase